MSYNGSGSYIAPAGNPVVTGTVVQSTWANTLVADIGGTFNNVLPRDGQAPMSAPLKIVDGTVTLPGISFNSDTNTGLYRPGAGLASLSVSGVEAFRAAPGRLLIGTTTDDGTSKLQVNGAATFASLTATTGTVTTLTATNLTVSSTLTLSSLSTATLTGTTSVSSPQFNATGNITLSAVGGRIIGDFSNATIASRTMLQTSTANSASAVSVIPNGTGTASTFVAINNSTPTNANYAYLQSNATDARIGADLYGTGSYLPITVYTGGSERLRVDTSGNLIANAGVTGYWQIPVGSTAQRPTAATGQLRFNNSLTQFEGYNGTIWGSIGGGATGGGADTIFVLNKTTMTTSYTIPTGQNASTVGPLLINSGIVLTVPSGQRVVVL